MARRAFGAWRAALAGAGVDTQGHVTTAAYLQYADRVRTQIRRAELNFIRLMSEILTGLLRVLACTILPSPM